uniref:Zinc finger protein Dzip1 n=3 Tax=Schistocephalus solidus TaxID=70667 RepID=A0A0X3Q5A9_SCHSO
MFTQNQGSPVAGQQQVMSANKLPGFFFRKRVERIDWRRLASVDVCQVASQMDIDALQENLVSVAFCDITSELDTRYVDTNFIKLFQLAQLLIEYLLYSQEYLTNGLEAVKLENENLKKEAEALKKRFEAQTQRLTSTRRECHRRRLLLLAQQQLMDAGPQAYHRCPHCPKAFINASFLNAHLHRRHAEIVNALEPLTQGLVSSPRAQRQALGRNQLESKIREEASDLTPNLEHQLREVLDQLKSQKQPPQTETVVSEWQPVVVTPPRAASSPPPMWKERVDLLEQELQKEREWFREAEERNRIWQAAVADQHKADIEAMRSMFEMELRNLREQNCQAQKDLFQLTVHKGPSNFGDLVDDPIDQQPMHEVCPKPKLSRAHDALADSLAELSTLAAVRHVQIVDDFSSIQESISTRPPRTSQSPPSRLVAPSTPESYQPISIESKMPTLRSRQSDELKPRVNFEHRPPAVSNVELRLEPTGNVIPYNLILNQLRSDPEALKRLRSEVEMLLSEQLVDHEIDPQASGISNEELKGRLDALKREREHLTRKHPNFAEIRASIAQQVDRMARIALHSKRDRDHHGKPVPTANQSKKPRMSASTPNSSTLAIAEEEAKNDVTQTSSPQPKQPSSSPHTSIVGTSQLRTDHPHRDSSTGTISMDRVVARRGVINGLNESMHTQSTFSLFEEVSEHPNGSRSERYLRTTSQPGIEEISLEGEEMGVDVGEPSAKRRFSTGHGDRHLSQDAPKVVKHEEAALPTSTAPCTITVLQSAAKSDSAQPALAKATTLESSEEWDSASDEENKAGPQTSFVSKRGAPSLEAKTRSKSPLEDLVVDDLTNLLDDLENTNETQIKKTDQTPKVRSSSLPGPSRPPFGRNNNFKRDEDDEVVSVSSLNPAEAGDTSVSLAFDTPPVGISTTSSGSMTPCRPPAYEAPVRPTTSIGRTPHTTLPRWSVVRLPPYFLISKRCVFCETLHQTLSKQTHRIQRSHFL